MKNKTRSFSDFQIVFFVLAAFAIICFLIYVLFFASAFSKRKEKENPAISLSGLQQVRYFYDENNTRNEVIINSVTYVFSETKMLSEVTVGEVKAYECGDGIHYHFFWMKDGSQTEMIRSTNIDLKSDNCGDFSVEIWIAKQ